MSRFAPLTRRRPLGRGSGSLARRTPLRSQRGLARGSELRRTPLRRFNPDRMKRRQHERFGPHAAFVCSHPCAVLGCLGEVEPHHTVCGAAGMAWHLVPLCREHHDEWHHHLGRRAFDGMYGTDLARLAAELWELSPFKSEYDR